LINQADAVNFQKCKKNPAVNVQLINGEITHRVEDGTNDKRCGLLGFLGGYRPIRLVFRFSVAGLPCLPSSRVGGVEEILSSLITQELRMYWLDRDLGMPLQERGTNLL